MNLARIFSIITFVFLPFQNLFSAGQFLSISFIAAILSAVFLLLFGVKFSAIGLAKSTGYTAPLLLAAIASLLLNNFGSAIDSQEVIRSLRTILFMLVFCLSLYLIQCKFKYVDIAKWIATGVIVSALYGMIDFCLSNYYNFYLDDYLYRFSVKENTGALAGIIRNRSTFGEPGLFALFISAITPMIIFEINAQRKIVRLALYVLLILSFFTTFSATQFSILILGGVVYSLFRKKFLSTFILVALVVSTAAYTVDLPPAVNVFLGKLALSSEYTEDASRLDRLDRIDSGFNILAKRVENEELTKIAFGGGPGWIASTFEGRGLVNTYLYFVLEFGLIGLFVFLIYLQIIWTANARKLDYGFRYSFLVLIVSLFALQGNYELFVMVAFWFMQLTASNKATFKP